MKLLLPRSFPPRPRYKMVHEFRLREPSMESRKRVSGFDDSEDQADPKRTHHRHSFEAEDLIITADVFSADSFSVIEALCRRVVREELETKIQSSYLSRKSQQNDVAGTRKLKLRFINEMRAVIFTNCKIEGKDGEALQVALCDGDAIVRTGPLSSGQIEMVVLNGEFGSNRKNKLETAWTTSEFNKNILPAREGKRALLVGHDQTLFLKNGVGFISKLSLTDNSCWTRLGKFILGAKMKDNEVLGIGEAITEPFKVMDQRGEVYRKHHPPSKEDQVWRLEGIGKGGLYHRRLCAENITNVYGFLECYHTNPSKLRQVLGNGKKVPNKTWKAMVDNALECLDPHVSLEYSIYELQSCNVVENNGTKGEVTDFPALVQLEAASTSHHNHTAGNTATGGNYYDGVWPELVAGLTESAGLPLPGVVDQNIHMKSSS